MTASRFEPADMRAMEGQLIDTRLWQHRHVLDLDDFSPEEVSTVFDTANVMQEILRRPVKKVPTLRDCTVATLFYEPSTRTRLSFETAAKRLGADTLSLVVTASSVAKGESLVDTVATLESVGVDIVVLRHSLAGASHLAASVTSRAKVINAGDGWHAHPTQALLDMYTLWRHCGKLAGIKVVIIGDIKHSRVARSNIWGLSLMGADIVLCAPPTLLPEGLGISSLNFPSVAVESNLALALNDADVVMVLRVQWERHSQGLLPGPQEYIRHYRLDEDKLALARPNALVLHPGPVNEDVEITAKVARGPQSVISEQVTNGVAVRMALLYLLSRGVV